MTKGNLEKSALYSTKRVEDLKCCKTNASKSKKTYILHYFLQFVDLFQMLSTKNANDIIIVKKKTIFSSSHKTIQFKIYMIRSIFWNVQSIRIFVQKWHINFFRVSFTQN